QLTGPWQVNFPKGWGAPEKIEFPQLISYTEHQNEGVKYFSGTAEYNTTINVPQNLINKNKLISLDLGEVSVIAEVRINGKKLGTYWKPPFKVDATSAIKSGINSIQIFVTNLWPNRLIGDERQFPADESYDIRAWEYLRNWKPDTKNPLPDPNRFTFTIFRAWNETDKLLPSGLIGPVTLKIVEVSD
ncbi:MAG: glycosylhydrolase-like jelly roll fold domain-containing protein, partial [Ginsengibacter sp.]